jgi:hypothetical protein
MRIRKGQPRRPFVVKGRPMPRHFFDPTPEQQNVVLIDAVTLQKTQRMITGCSEAFN